jgi:hypothetical protein
MPSKLIYKSIKIQLYKTENLPSVLHGFKTPLLKLSEERKAECFKPGC